MIFTCFISLGDFWGWTFRRKFSGVIHVYKNYLYIYTVNCDGSSLVSKMSPSPPLTKHSNTRTWQSCRGTHAKVPPMVEGALQKSLDDDDDDDDDDDGSDGSDGSSVIITTIVMILVILRLFISIMLQQKPSWFFSTPKKASLQDPATQKTFYGNLAGVSVSSHLISSRFWTSIHPFNSCNAHSQMHKMHLSWAQRSNSHTHWKMNMGPKNGGFGRWFSFSLGCFLGSSRSFSGL